MFMLGARYLEYDEATDTEVEVPCDLLVFDTGTFIGTGWSSVRACVRACVMLP